ncbi:MAG TPA: glycosyltransferase family 4 protein, partial [Gemmatimonadaceae bacterium]|nr:glycosyltransferase family 4 protein [Gemmatimonadaceae bacterium]
DLALKLGGGGSYAVNYHAFHQLSRHFDSQYVGPIVPKPPALQVLVSRLRRKVLGMPGRFAYFSPTTLSANARQVESQLNPDTRAILFRSAARWSRVKHRVPYFVYLDAVFHTFFENTFHKEDFIRSDIERICEEEAKFLENADGVFFESMWGMQKAKHAYSLHGPTYLNVGRGGILDPPGKDSWDGSSHEIVTVAMNFAQKGGDVVLEVFNRLKPAFPELTWRIVGGPPPSGIESLPGVKYEGVLDPGDAHERQQLENIMCNAFILIHPTREDTSPLVITEAAYFGCPSISVNRFAIPDLVVDGVTGLLVSEPHAALIASALTELLQNPQRYRDMRDNARAHGLANSQWDRVGDLMNQRIADVISRNAK